MGGIRSLRTCPDLLAPSFIYMDSWTSILIFKAVLYGHLRDTLRWQGMILASTFLAASWQATLLALLPAAGFWCQW